eukprot:11755861-Alexandrium_andersonii.AAC.1
MERHAVLRPAGGWCVRWRGAFCSAAWAPAEEDNAEVGAEVVMMPPASDEQGVVGMTFGSTW